MLSGTALAINYNTYGSQFQTVTGSQKSVNIARSLSRLKSIVVSHVGGMTSPKSIVHEELNTLYHPMANSVKTLGLDL